MGILLESLLFFNQKLYYINYIKKLPIIIPNKFYFQSQISGLESLGHKTNRTNINNIVCAITKTTKGIFGNADYRKNGEVVGY